VQPHTVYYLGETMKINTLLLASALTSSGVWAAQSKLEQQITPAPQMGIMDSYNQHITNAPFLLNLDSQPKEQMGPYLTRQYFHGTQSTFVKWVAKKGGKVPLHKHPNEQVTWIMSGEAKVFSGGKQYLMKAGDMMVIPANVPHEFHFTQDTVDIDFFAPARQDWIDGTASYIKQK